MKILRDFFKRSDITFTTKESLIRFHGEQSGDVENKIKELWRNSLNEFKEVEEAYLALTQFSSKKIIHPTLCIYPEISKPKNIIKKLSNDFKSKFNSQEYLDILFLTEKMRNECKSKCNYFYKRENK